MLRVAWFFLVREGEVEGRYMSNDLKEVVPTIIIMSNCILILYTLNIINSPSFPKYVQYIIERLNISLPKHLNLNLIKTCEHQIILV